MISLNSLTLIELCIVQLLHQKRVTEKKGGGDRVRVEIFPQDKAGSRSYVIHLPPLATPISGAQAFF